MSPDAELEVRSSSVKRPRNGRWRWRWLRMESSFWIVPRDGDCLGLVVWFGLGWLSWFGCKVG